MKIGPIRRLVQSALVLSVGVCWASAATATPIRFEVSHSSAKASGVVLGSTVSINPRSLPAPLSLGLAESSVGLGVILNSFVSGSVGVLNNPGPIAFGDGGLFGVTFKGFQRSALSGTVMATVSLSRTPQTVPEPATLTLLGAGLAAFAFGARKRRQAKAAS